MTEQEFDGKIRARLSEPQDEIPAGLWEKVERRLDDAGAVPQRRVVPLRKWLWGMSGAAAAVAVLVFSGVRLLAPKTGGIAGTSVETFDIVKTQPAERQHAGLLAMSESDGAASPQAAPKDYKALCGSAENTHPQTDVPDLQDTCAAVPSEENSAPEEADTAAPEVQQPSLVDTDAAGEPECEIKVDNSDIEAVYGTEGSSAKRKRTPFELTVGGNSFGGPQKGRVPRMMYSQGHRTPSATFVENGNSDNFDLPLSFGVGVKYSITRWLGIGVGVNYTLLGKKTSGTYYTDDGWSYDVDMKNRQHYIGIPVDVFFSVFRNRWWDTYATVGGCVEKCISCKYTGFYEGEQLTYSPRVNSVQASVKVGLGVEFSPLSFMGIYIDPSLRYYFDNGQPRSVRTAQPLAFGVEAGLRFRL